MRLPSRFDEGNSAAAAPLGRAGLGFRVAGLKPPRGLVENREGLMGLGSRFYSRESTV